MRQTRLGTLVLVVGLALGPLTFAPGAAQVKTPPDFVFEQGKDAPGPVTFSHEKHNEKVDKCTACHTKVFKFKRGTSGTPTMAAMKEGKFCGACHDGKTEVGGKAVFTTDDKANCERCHRK